MTNERESQVIKKKIEDFFNNLNDEHNTTVISIKLEWIEHLTMEHHNKYLLVNCDIITKL